MTTGTGQATPADAPVTTVAVMGSCVGRDVFNSRFSPGYRSRYRVAATSFRASVISVMSPPIPPAPDGLETLSPGSRRMFLADLAKPFPGELAASPPDLLVVDLAADARLGIADLGDGRCITWNRAQLRRATGFASWLRQEGITLRMLRPDRLADRAEYLDRFGQAIARFAAHLRAVAPRTQVVLVRARVTTELWLPGLPEPVQLAAHRATPPSDPDQTNVAWGALDELAIAHTDWRVVDLRAGRYPTSDTHPWGAGGLHFAPDYHRDLLAGIDRVVAERHVALPGPERVLVGSPSTVIGRSWDAEPGAGVARPRPPRERARPAARPLPRRRHLVHRLLGPVRAVRRRLSKAA